MSLQTPLQEIIKEYNASQYPFWDLDNIDIQGILTISEEIRNKFNNLLIVGTGASVTNARALISILPTPKFNINYLDNIDVTFINNTLLGLNPKDTAILVISKSGDTNETLAMLDYLIQNNFISDNLYIITEDKDSHLKQIGLKYNSIFINHAKDIGGRFAILTEVGLLPASIAGVDIKVLIEVCASNLDKLLQDMPQSLEEAEWILENYNQNKNCYVIMHYGDQLSGLFEWIRQMYAESLGKNDFGFTPHIARGTIDQHSQIQLYLDGPNDKFFSIVYLNQNARNELISHEANLNRLMHIHANAAYKSLLERKRNVRFTEIKEPYQHIGFTPHIARGTIDQHSQIQLYLDGPNDKFFSIVYLNQNARNELISHEANLNRLMHIHANAAYKSLLERKRNVRFTEIKEPYQHITNTILSTMLNIMLIARARQFNPFDQAAVEVYKKYVSRPSV